MDDRIARERKLDAPDAFSLVRLGARVNGYVAAPAELQRIHTIYYDTDDLRLARWGASLCYRHPGGWTLKLADVDAPLDELAHREHTFAAGPDAVPQAALDLTTAFLRGEPLVPVVELQTLRISRRIRGDGGSELAEVLEDDVRVIAGNRTIHRFRQLEVAPVQPAPAGISEVIWGLLRAEGAEPADAATCAVLLGPRSDAPPFALPEVGGDALGADLFCVAFGAAAERLLRTDALLRHPTDDPEPVHQARVAVRRLRSHLRTFAPVLDRAWATELAERLRWLGDVLGAARDADVLLEQLRARAAVLPGGERSRVDALLARFGAVRTAAYDQVAEALGDARYVPLLDAVVAGVERPGLVAEAFAPATEVVPALLQSSWRKLRNAVHRRSHPPADAELHRIRIRAKRTRYVAEACAPTSGKSARRFARCVEELQSALGEQHDAVVAYGRLRELATETELAFIAGELAALSLRDAEHGRHGWRDVWRAAERERFWSTA